MVFQFQTKTTMKEYNCEKWFILSDMVSSMEISADTLSHALLTYKKKVSDDFGIEISEHAMKNKQPMYIDTAAGTVQTGYIITGKTEFNNDYKGWVTQYIDLCVTVNILVSPFERS